MTVYGSPFRLKMEPTGSRSANSCLLASVPSTTTRRTSSQSAPVIKRPRSTSIVRISW